MRRRTTNTTAVALFAGATLLGALSACSSPDSAADTGSDTASATAAPEQNTPEATADATPEPSADASAEKSAGYSDGIYTESGQYTTPGGIEEVAVTLTLENNIITDVSVEGSGESPNSKQFQGEFIGGIAEVVVGKNIDELAVDKVAGSSLTSTGFNKAVDAIKADALAE